MITIRIHWLWFPLTEVLIDKVLMSTKSIGSIGIFQSLSRNLCFFKTSLLYQNKFIYSREKISLFLNCNIIISSECPTSDKSVSHLKSRLKI